MRMATGDNAASRGRDCRCAQDADFGPEFERKSRNQSHEPMPAKSEKQRRLMGAALSYKRGENKHPSQEVKHVADSMTETQLEDMAKKPIAAKKRK
jgi:hypothetical protein